ncbi:hypothetical protein ACQBAR_09540 [Propionibacteriaceae bacterium Y1685]|uniref:hypothetical protein n=1 Tax=Microlunatus sp. Y1700 TaxID=3418487 RepID=UPI003B77428F
MRDDRTDPLDKLLGELADEAAGGQRLPAAEVRRLGQRRRFRRMLIGLAAMTAALLLAAAAIVIVRQQDTDPSRPDIAAPPTASTAPTAAPSSSPPAPVIDADDLPSAEDIVWDDTIAFTRTETEDGPMPCVERPSGGVAAVAEVRGDYRATDTELPHATVTLLQYGSVQEATRAAADFEQQLQDCAATEQERHGADVRGSEVYEIALGETGLHYTETIVPAEGNEDGWFRSLGVHRVGDRIALVAFEHQALEYYVAHTEQEDEGGLPPHPMRLTMPTVAQALGEESASGPTSSTSESPR